MVSLNITHMFPLRKVVLIRINISCIMLTGSLMLITTALQSPQAGIAPLVGITSLGEATFRDASGVEYHAQP